MELTSYELLDVMASWKADTGYNITNLMSIYSAYILVAYFMGSKLTRAQVLIVSGLMLLFALITITQISINLRSLAEFSIVDHEQYGAHADVVLWSKASRWIIVSGCITALLASFYFMWTVRHPRKE